jgi:murein DD-endopeptidase MepM/ murein hydrolase activator NlpD
MPQIKPLEGGEQFQGYTEKAQFDPINVPDPNQGLGNLLSTVNSSFQNMSASGQQQFEQQANQWQQLSQFSQTLTQAIGVGYKMYDENAKEEALAQFNTDQVAQQEALTRFKPLEDTLSAVNAAHDQQALAAQKAGAPIEVTEQIKSMGGRKAYWYKTFVAKDAGENLKTWIQEQETNNTTVVEFEGKKLAINDPRWDPAERAGLRRQLEVQYQKAKGLDQVNPGMLAKYYMPGANKAHAELMSESRKQFGIDKSRVNRDLALAKFAQDNNLSQALLALASTVDENGKPLGFGGAWRDLKKNISDLNKVGKLSPEAYVNMKAQIDPETGKSYGERFKTQFALMEEERASELRQNVADSDAEIAMLQKEDLNAIMAEITANPQSDAQINTIIEMWKKKYSTTEIPSQLKDYQTNSTLQARDKKDQEVELNKLLASDLLTTKELNSGKYFDEFKIKYKSQAQATDKLYGEGGAVAKASKYQIKAIEDAIRAPGKLFDNDSISDPSVNFATGAALAELERQAKVLKRANPAITWDVAYGQAGQALVQEIKAAQEKGSGYSRWKTNGGIGPESVFPAFSTGMSSQQKVQAAQNKISYMRSTVVNGGLAALKENKNNLFTEAELKALANPDNKDFGKIGMITGWLNQQGKNVTIDEAINLALGSAGLKREAPFKQDPYEQTALSANMIRLLTSPTPARISRVAAQGALPPPTIRQGVEGGRDVIQAAISFGLPPAIAPLAGVVFGLESGWGKFQSGKNNVFNIKAAKGQGTMMASPEGDGKVYNSWWRDYSSPIQSVNDFVKLLKEPRYARVLKAATPVEALRELKAAGYATDPRYVEKASPLFRSLGINPNQPYAYQGLTSSPWSNPALMGNAAKQFITGKTGIGTGAHLDMRVFNPSTGDYDNPKGYENYLVVGGVPIAKKYSVTSGYGPRKPPVAGASPFHKGVDYGTPEGTAVTVRGGSYLRTWWDEGGGGVVSSYRLPDGKELRLLHGSKQNLQS